MTFIFMSLNSQESLRNPSSQPKNSTSTHLEYLDSVATCLYVNQIKKDQ